MPLALIRSSLVTQVADAIRAEVLRGAWKEWLPSERDISRSLHVSRNTCRGGLRVLQREMLLEPIKGRGIRLTKLAAGQTRSIADPSHSVGVIMPLPLARMPPHSGVVLDELKDELTLSGNQIHLHDGSTFYSGNPDKALERLVAHNRHDCWILTRSTEPMQKWFMKRSIPCVVSGSLYPGIKLPSADQDRRAMCRHAAGRLISLGHRRLVFLNRRVRAAGDVESELGFMEGVKASSHADLDARVLYHEDTRDSTVLLLDGLWRRSAAPPTGLLIANSYCYLSAMSALARNGLRVPADVSLISRDDDTFLVYLLPEPARYVLDHSQLARKISSLIRALLSHAGAKLEPAKIISRFEAGSSCGAVAQAEPVQRARRSRSTTHVSITPPRASNKPQSTGTPAPSDRPAQRRSDPGSSAPGR
jgi:LacI family transcriptional regulator